MESDIDFSSGLQSTHCVQLYQIFLRLETTQEQGQYIICFISLVPLSVKRVFENYIFITKISWRF